MPELAQVETVLLVLALCLLTLLVIISLRRRLQMSGPGHSPCAVRDRGRWRAGVLKYRSDRLVWSPRMGPGLGSLHVVTRARLRDLRRTEVAVDELPATSRSREPVGAVLTLSDGSVIELALDRAAYNGLSAWFEAAPPASNALYL